MDVRCRVCMKVLGHVKLVLVAPMVVERLRKNLKIGRKNNLFVDKGLIRYIKLQKHGIECDPPLQEDREKM